MLAAEHTHKYVLSYHISCYSSMQATASALTSSFYRLYRTLFLNSIHLALPYIQFWSHDMIDPSWPFSERLRSITWMVTCISTWYHHLRTRMFRYRRFYSETEYQELVPLTADTNTPFVFVSPTTPDVSRVTSFYEAFQVNLTASFIICSSWLQFW